MPSQTKAPTAEVDFNDGSLFSWTGTAPAASVTITTGGANAPVSQMLFYSGFGFSLASNPTTGSFVLVRNWSAGVGSNLNVQDYIVSLWWWNGSAIVLGTNLAAAGNWPGTHSYNVPSGDMSHITSAMANDTGSHTDTGTFAGTGVTGSVGIFVQIQDTDGGGGNPQGTASISDAELSFSYGDAPNQNYFGLSMDVPKPRERTIMLPYQCRCGERILYQTRKLWLPEPLYPLAC